MCVLFMCVPVCAHKQSIKELEGMLFDPHIQRELVIIDAAHTYDLNPHTANYNSEAQILNGLYEGLFSYDPLTLEALPAAVKSFRISRDRKTWTFTLRDDLAFSNGEAIEAAHVKDSWLTLLNPASQAPFASLLDCIKGVSDYRTGKGAAEKVGIQVKNKRTLAVHLNTPAEHFPKILCHHAFAVTHRNKDVYSGAFMLKERGSKLTVLKKNPHYYDAANVALPSIRIINSDDTDANTFAFNTGTAHWVTGALNAQKVYESENIVIYPQFGTEFWFFKAGKAPWNNPRIRQAVLSAVPRNQLREDSVVPAQSLILPLPAYPEVYGITDEENEDARDSFLQALKDSGEEQGQKKQPAFTLSIPDFAYVKKQASFIVQALQDLGVDVSVETSPGDRYLEGLNTSEADMFTYTWIGDFADPLAFLELFRSASTLRETEWKNAHFDALLEQAALITDTEKRYQKLAEAEQLLFAEAVIFPVSHPISFNAVDMEILGGWFINPQNIHPFKYLFFKENQKSEELREGFI